MRSQSDSREQKITIEKMKVEYIVMEKIQSDSILCNILFSGNKPCPGSFGWETPSGTQKNVILSPAQRGEESGEAEITPFNHEQGSGLSADTGIFFHKERII